MSERVYNTAFLFQELISPAFLTTAIKEIGILVFAIIIIYDFASFIYKFYTIATIHRDYYICPTLRVCKKTAE